MTTPLKLLPRTEERPVSVRALEAARTVTYRRGMRREKYPDMVTVTDAAEASGLSTSVIQRHLRLLRHGNPDVVAALERGEITFYAAERLVAALSKEEQAEAVKQMPQKKGRVSKVLGESTYRASSSRKSPSKIVEQCVTMIEVASMSVVPFDASHFTVAEARDWMHRLDDALSTINTFMNAIEVTNAKR